MIGIGTKDLISWIDIEIDQLRCNDSPYREATRIL